MPSIHIPEDTWTALLLQEGGDREAAREKVKAAVRKEVDGDE